MTAIGTAVGWTLLHSLWEGSAIAAALAAALVTTRAPRIRYAAACAALLMMAAGFGLTFLRMLPDGSHGVLEATPVPFPAWNVRAGVDDGSSLNLNLAALIPWLAPLWMTGVGLFYVWQFVSWISVCRLRRRGVCSAPEFWQNRMSRLSARLQLAGPVELLESCMVDAPMVFGHFRPVILMPIGLLSGLPAGQIEAILLHELAHIRRRDYLVNVLQRLVEGLMFYHPAAWWISSVIRNERENCCDDVAAALAGDVREYAAALAALEANRQPVREPALAATGGSLVKRINRLLYPGSSKGTFTPGLAAVVLMAMSALGLAAWQVKPGKSAEDASGTLIMLSDTFEKWLNEEVVYIVGDDERTAFLKLAADDERKKFIEQFWLRRDPTPGTANNEFKEEHYRRIAYANGRFAASSRPGWQTDRGHMYIVYGPPDEIDSHRAGEPGFYPHETWRYTHIDGIGDNLLFTFIDRNRNGQLVLAPATDH